MSLRSRDARLSLQQSSLISRARVMGTGTALPIALTDTELTKLLSVALSDLSIDPASITGVRLPREGQSYYEISIDWFEGTNSHQPFVDAFLAATAEVADFDTYFAGLAELHKRRKKYARILSAQPLPKLVQVAPRSLLERVMEK